MNDRVLRRLRAWFSPSRPPREAAIVRVMNPARCIELASRVEVADTGAARSKGLLGRRGLGKGAGLWIVPCESVHTFGMKFSIDLIYLDRNHRIRKIRKSVPPWRISVCLTAHSVLELAAGAVGDGDAQPGDIVTLLPVDSSMSLNEEASAAE
jgi:uncharacterized membrane protein (UPF0127 family)